MKAGTAAFHPGTPKTGALGAPALALACALVIAPMSSSPAFAAQESAASGQSSGQSAAQREKAPLPDAPQPSRDQPPQDQPYQDQGDRATPANTAPPREPANTAPPSTDASRADRLPNPNPERQPEQSSSEQSRGDISPPPADELAHPDGGAAHERNPLRAMKNVEVGTFYYKQGNYKAAISRFREALEFKPRDAVATFKLAQALEKSGELDEARLHYEAYLTILRDGPDAGEARKALERLRKR